MAGGGCVEHAHDELRSQQSIKANLTSFAQSRNSEKCYLFT